jgi:PKD repeat protein
VLAHKINFFVSDSVLCKKQEIQFSVKGDTSGFGVYTWDMGDGVVVSSKVASIAHQYRQPGNYTVTLMATSLSNCTDTIIKQNYIRVNGPSAKFGSSAVGTCVNTNIVFTDSTQTDKVNAIKTWNWKV